MSVKKDEPFCTKVGRRYKEIKKLEDIMENGGYES